MKNPLLLIAALLFCMFANAQQPQVSYSGTFEEPESGYVRLLQLTNGNTFFFYIDPKKGFVANLYDKNHKPMGQKPIKGKLWNDKKIGKSAIKGLYEIGGAPVMFIQQEQKNGIALIRLCFNPNTGTVDKEDVLGTVPGMNMFSGYAIAFGGVEPNDIYVEKDALSDGYGVVFFNGFAKKREDRIRAVHYSGKHQVLSDAYYNSPDNKFKYQNFISMTVDDDKALYLAIYGFNTQSSGGNDSRVIIASIKAGEKEYTSNLLEFTDDFNYTQALMQYNPGSHLLELLTLTRTSTNSNLLLSRSTTYYYTLMTYIDPATLTVAFKKTVDGDLINDYAKGIGLKHRYSGLPQQMIINKDNTTTILFEELSTKEYYRNGRLVRVETKRGPLGVAEVSETGVEKNGYAILKEQLAYGYINALDMAKQSNGRWKHGRSIWNDNNEFLSFSYANTQNNRYLIFNDYAKNIGKEESDDHRKTIKTVSNTHAICYKLDNGTPTKFYLFGQPKDKNKSTFCNLESSHYLKDNNTYAAIVIERDGRKKNARIAWVTFE